MPKKKRSTEMNDEPGGLSDAEIAEIERTTDPSGMLRALFVGFLGISILMWAIFVIASGYNLRATSREKYTSGVVVELTSRKDSNGNEFFYPVVEINLPEQGRTRLQLTQGDWPAAYQTGQPVNVFYDPQNLAGARISGNVTGRWILPMITGILGAAFLAAVIFVWWMKRGEPSRAALVER
jgi:hypothetical protein